LKISGKVESIQFDDRHGELRLTGYERVIWIDAIAKLKVKDLKVGDTVTVTAKPGRYYEFLTDIERGEVSPLAACATERANGSPHAEPSPKPYVPTREKGLPPTPGKGRACSARFMAKFQDLVAKGLTVQELVDELCLQESEIYQLKQAIETKQAIEEKVHTCGLRVDTDFDVIRPRHYVELARVKDPERQVELAEKVAKEQISVQKLREEIQGPKPPPPPRKEWIDQGIQITCKTCGEHFHLLHFAPGNHKLEPVTVVGK